MAWPAQPGGQVFGQPGWPAAQAAAPPPSGFAAFSQGAAPSPGSAFGFSPQPAQQPAAAGFGFQQFQQAATQQAAQAGFGQQQHAAAAAGFGQQQAAGGGFGFANQQQQQQQQATLRGFGFGQSQTAQQQAAGGGFGFGQQASQQPAADSMFDAGQQHPTTQGRPAADGFGFGQQQQAAQQQQQQAAPGGFGFGHVQQQQQAAPGGFGFGQVQQAAQQQQPAAGGFNFGQQQPAGAGIFGFGQQQQAAAQQPDAASSQFGSGFGQHAAAPASGTGQQQHASPAPGGFGFGQQQQQPSPAPGPVKFSFGSAQRRKPQQERQQLPPGAAAAFATAEGDVGGEQANHEAELAAAKAAALANLPKFQGGGGGGAPRSGGPSAAAGRAPTAAAATARAPPPPPQAARRSGSPAPTAGGGGGGAGSGLDGEEVARRAQRASRFLAATPAAAPSPAPGLESAALMQQPAVPQQQRRQQAQQQQQAEQQRSQQQQHPAQERSGTPEPDDADEGGVRVGAIVGTCEEMCPAPERERRARLSDIQIFERLELENSALTSAELAVKRFARTIDDSNNAPEYFRTRGALRRTMAYLRDLLDRQDARLGLIHKFLWDRYRSVRQDLYIQGMDDEFAVSIFEEVVRFHVLSEHELCEEEASITEMEGFNSHLNMEQMNKALISLTDMYSKLAAAGRPIPTEAEFRAYHLLSLMGRHGKFKGDLQGFLSMLQAMRPEVRGAAPIQWVLNLQRAYVSSNFVRFFGLVRQAPYLLACMSHIYFGQVRGTALRTLGETLSPKPDMPSAVELGWLAHVLMLDSAADAQQLCALHGFDTGMQAGVPVALLVKGAYVDPPPPVPRKRSAIITRLAPATRSLAVTTPCLPPMSAAEAAQLEQQRQEHMQRQRVEEAKRAQQAAEQRSQQQVAMAAAEVQQRQEEAAARQAEQARLQEQLLAQQHAAQLAAQRQQQAAQQQQEEQRRQQEMEAARQQQERQLVEQRRQQQDQQQRAAAEAEQRQREAWEAEQRRRQAAAEAERQRLAEVERLRLEQQRRREEQARVRREAKRRRAIQCLYLARWRQETRRLIEQRERQQRLAANLKACRASARDGAAARAVADELEDLQLFDPPLEAAAGSGSRQQHTGAAAVPAPAPAGARAAIDLPALAAPLLLQRSPGARMLYWKLVLAPAGLALGGGSTGGGSRSEQQRLQQLHTWLSMQLAGGRPVKATAAAAAAASSGAAYVDGPLPLLRCSGSAGASNGGDSAAGPRQAELTTCLSSLDSGSSGGGSGAPGRAAAALAGASGVIVAVPISTTGLAALQQWLPQQSSTAVPLPTLLVAATDAGAQQWQQEFSSSSSSSSLAGAVRVVSVQQAASAQAGATTAAAAAAAASARGGRAGSRQQRPAASASLCRQQLVQGLRWLAAHAPPQPRLKIAPVQDVALDALAAACAPLQRAPAMAAGGLPAAQLLCAALQQALALVEEVAARSSHSTAAAWRWPPPELAPLPLQSWHDGSTLQAVSAAVRQFRLDADSLMRLAEGSSQEALTVAAHTQLAALQAAALPLVLPLEVEHWFRQQLEAARAAPPPPSPSLLLPAAALPAVQRTAEPSSSLSLRQKRKWQDGGLPSAAAERQAAPAVAAAGRSWAAVAAGAGAGPASRPMGAAVTAAAHAGQHAGQHAPALSRLPFWRQFKQQLLAEQQQELGLQQHAVLAASGVDRMPPAAGCFVDDVHQEQEEEQQERAVPAAHSRLPLLQQLRQAATTEQAATNQLIRLALL